MPHHAFAGGPSSEANDMMPVMLVAVSAKAANDWLIVAARPVRNRDSTLPKRLAQRVKIDRINTVKLQIIVSQRKP